MSRNVELVLAGNHRGGSAISDGLLEAGARSRLRSAFLVDAKPGRAEALARRYQAAGVPTESRVALCEEELPGLDEEGRVVALSVDRLDSMAASARSIHRTRTIAQGVGQGAQSASGEAPPTFGLHLGLFPERQTERAGAIDLLEVFATLAPPTSSAVLRRDPLGAVELHRTRTQTSRLTAHRLLDVERSLTDEHVARLLWHDEAYPLVLARTAEATPRRLSEMALDLGLHRGTSAVALYNRQAPRIDVFVIEPSRRRDGSLVRMWVPFQRLLSPPAARAPRTPGRRNGMDWENALGLGLAVAGTLAAGASLALSATFTD